MSDQDFESEMRPSLAQGGWFGRRRLYIAGAIAGIALIAALGSPAGHRMLAQVPSFGSGLAAVAASFDEGPGFGPGFAAGWQGGLFDGIIEAVVEARADRAVRHLAIEIDATAEQQDKLRAIVRDAVKDLLPVREKIMAARATARDLLTQQTIDRAAIEKFRADVIATHDAVSKRVVQAVADAAEVLTPDQRRKIADMAAARHGHWGWRGGPWSGGPWGHGPWGH